LISYKLKRILTIIWRFIVIQNRIIKYKTRIGQNTGTSNSWKNVRNIDNSVDFTTEYQNLNSGNRRINGRNSSFALVGKDGPESSN
jgi:hypothetical protein